MSKFWTAFALGVVTGILVAPGKGSETREKIAQKGKELKRKFNDFVDSLHDDFESAKEEAGSMADHATQKARSFANEAGSWGNV